MKFIFLFLTLVFIIIIYLIYNNKREDFSALAAAKAVAAEAVAAHNTALAAAKAVAAEAVAAHNTALAAAKAAALGDDVVLQKEDFDKCRNLEEKNIISDKNLFYEFDSSNDYNSINNINCNRLCIKEDNGNVECISKEELFNAINLPDFRRHSICVGDACLNKNGINKLNGKDMVMFKSAFKGNSNFNKKCMGYGINTARTCANNDNNYSALIPLHTLRPTDCNEDSSKFRILEGLPMSVINKWSVNKIKLKEDSTLQQQHMVHGKRV